MIDHNDALPVVRQCKIQSLSQSSVYYRRQPVFPYRLRGLPTTRPNPVWAMDITYIPMERGFVYLAAVIGQGCWRDNVFVERLWKRVRYEEVDLHTYDTGRRQAGFGALLPVLQHSPATLVA